MGRINMRKIVTALVLCAGLAFVALAASPIPVHPPAPGVTATKAVELATQFMGATTNTTRYCSAVTLNEGRMIPAPRGSARHWVVTFQEAGANRSELRRVYIDMEGRASDDVPPRSKQD